VELTHSCIITENIKALTEFYEKVLEIKPETYGDDYAEFPTDAGVLSLFSFKAHEELAPGSSKPATNGCLELEFQVEDVN
jgi:catechol 2,3-dioxygenase-like lactoylglutathione lyase family enzyme